jgi:nanoRNase/pAp phosphatase (c-di-AMP/oligoRNAs hydrolase)
MRAVMSMEAGAIAVDSFCNQESSMRLKELLLSLPSDQRIAIITQDDPDPDAIGSALGLQRICGHIRPDLTAKIFHGGCISHPQNLTMVQRLVINLEEIGVFEEWRKEHERNQRNPRNSAVGPAPFVMLVDATFTGGNNIPSTDALPDAVFDHHKDRPAPDTRFVDVREVGSTSTIITEHIVHLGVPIGPKLATALFFGLHNDTKGFAMAMSPVDWAAMRFLQPKIDPELFREIHEYPLPNYLWELEQLAQESKRHKGSMLVAGLGLLAAARRDGLAHVADRLVRLDDVDTVLVHAIVDDMIQASFRTTNAAVNANELMKKIFGERTAGGKEGAGGAKVPIGFLAPKDIDEGTRVLFTRYVNELIARRAFQLFLDKAAAVAPDRSSSS